MRWEDHANKIIDIASVILVILYGLLYVFYGVSLGLMVNLLALIPILFIAIHFGMQLGAITGLGISVFISIVRIVSNDPEFEILRAILIAVLAGVGGGTYGLLSDQRKALRESERILEEKVADKTIELSQLVERLEGEVIKRRETEIEIRELNKKLEREMSERIIVAEELKQLNDELEIRVSERTGELEKMVNLMAGREVRMAELKKVIKKLRQQLVEADIDPLADDPLNEP